MTTDPAPRDLATASDPDLLVAIAREAGAAILEIYGQADLGVESKGDGSPLTAADRAAHEIIVDRLEAEAGTIPVLSEESRSVPYETRAAWGRFFLVDPLDGTKEFIKRNGEFTVNIALIEDGVPVAGVVHAPVLDTTYHGRIGAGAMRIEGDAAPVPIQVVDPPEPDVRPWRIVASRSHQNEATQAFLDRLPTHDVVSCGSSLKICRVAEGAADMYPRLGPTMEWDTAAAHAVLTAAGGRLVDLTGRALRYNKADLHNPHFVATGVLDPTPFLA